MELKTIQSRIYEIRSQKVMLDFALAELYVTETKRLKEAVRRSRDRFPPDFIFVLSRDEYNSLRTQIASLETGKGKFSNYPPFAFTEQGVKGCPECKSHSVIVQNYLTRTLRKSQQPARG